MDWKFFAPLILNAVGTVMVLTSAIWISFNKNKADEIIRAKNEEIINIQKELQIKTDTISNLAEHNLNVLTGGDSFCYLEFIPESDKAVVLATVKGNYPVYDVGCTILDSKVFENIRKGHFHEDMATRPKHLRIGNRAPNTSTAISMFDLEGGDEKNYTIDISARNGRVIQVVKFRRVDGKWTHAMIVFRTGGTVLLEYKDKRFPVREGEDLWRSSGANFPPKTEDEATSPEGLPKNSRT